MTDLMYKTEIQEVIRAQYRAVDVTGRPPRAINPYSKEDVASLPASAVAWSLGVGHPVARAGLQPGETVVDLAAAGGSTPSWPPGWWVPPGG